MLSSSREAGPHRLAVVRRRRFYAYVQFAGPVCALRRRVDGRLDPLTTAPTTSRVLKPAAMSGARPESIANHSPFDFERRCSKSALKPDRGPAVFLFIAAIDATELARTASLEEIAPAPHCGTATTGRFLPPTTSPDHDHGAAPAWLAAATSRGRSRSAACPGGGASTSPKLVRVNRSACLEDGRSAVLPACLNGRR